MSHTEIVETRGKFRAVIEVDEYPHHPDGDFFGNVYYGDRGRFNLVGGAHRSPHDHADTLDAAWGHFMDWDKIERYLRMFHDVRGFDRFDTQEGVYVCIITSWDLELWGWDVSDPESWPKHEDGRTYDPSENCLTEWRAYSDGDVWSVRVEKNITWHADDEDYADQDSWEEVDETQVFGYYGEEWAREAATDSLDDSTPRPCRKCGEPIKREDRTVEGHVAIGPWPWVHVTPDDSHEPDASVLQ